MFARSPRADDSRGHLVGRGLLGAILFIGLLVPGGHELASGEPPSITDALRFRTAFGLDADPDRLAALEADPGADRRFGVPLLAAEVGEINRRIDLQLAIDPMNTYLEGQDGFGGLYIDQRSGGVIDVALTAEPDAAQLSSLRLLSPPGVSVRTRVVASTLRQLLAAYDRASSETTGLIAQGIPIVSIGVDIINNRLDVGVEETSLSIAAKLQELYASVDVFTHGEAAQQPAFGPCPSRSNCTNPLRGGIALNVNGFASTATLLVEKPNSNIQLLIAGHAGQGAPVGTTVKHNGISIGTVSATAFYDGTRADAKIVDISNSQAAKNWIYIAPSSVKNITSVEGNPEVGDFVCKSGITTGVSCGNITYLFVTVWYGAPYNVHLIYQGRANYAIGSGDSGAPVYYPIPNSGNAVAVGLASSTQGAFSHMYYVEFELIADVCVTSAC